MDIRAASAAVHAPRANERVSAPESSAERRKTAPDSSVERKEAEHAAAARRQEARRDEQHRVDMRA